MRAALKKSGFIKERTTVHTLRHSSLATSFTRKVEQTLDIIQKFCGHKVVLKLPMIYTHVLKKMATDRISSPLDRLVDENNKKNFKD
jgi:integrase